jgi:hypothetical protein
MKQDVAGRRVGRFGESLTFETDQLLAPALRPQIDGLERAHCSVWDEDHPAPTGQDAGIVQVAFPRGVRRENNTRIPTAI